MAPISLAQSPVSSPDMRSQTAYTASVEAVLVCGRAQRLSSPRSRPSRPSSRGWARPSSRESCRRGARRAARHSRPWPRVLPRLPADLWCCHYRELSQCAGRDGAETTAAAALHRRSRSATFARLRHERAARAARGSRRGSFRRVCCRETAASGRTGGRSSRCAQFDVPRASKLVVFFLGVLRGIRVHCDPSGPTAKRKWCACGDRETCDLRVCRERAETEKKRGKIAIFCHFFVFLREKTAFFLAGAPPPHPRPFTRRISPISPGKIVDFALFHRGRPSSRGSPGDNFFLLHQSIDLDELYPTVQVSQIVTRRKHFFCEMRM